nr:hypothetical protein [Tanacetum cinerariifolium]
MSIPVFADLESSTQANGAQSSRVPTPLPEDPYEAIRQAYLVGTDTESEPFEDPESKTPESPHIVTPPTCHVEESEGSGTSGVRSTTSDSTTPLSPDYPFTHTTPVLVPILRRTTHMVVCVLPVMSPGLSVVIAEVAAMPDSAFHKRFRSSYDSLPSPTLPVRKRYRGTYELILGTDSEEIDESSDSDSKSKDTEDEGPTAEDEDPAVRDKGLVARVEGPDVDDESYGLDDESYGLDYESHGVDDEICGLDNEGYGIKSDGLGLGEEEVVPEGQQQAAPVVRTTVSTPLGLGYGALRRRELALEEDRMYSTFEVGQCSGSTPEPGRSERTPPSPDWTPGSFSISSSLSVIPSPVSSPTISLTVPSPIPSPMPTSTSSIPVDEDQFIERYRFRSLEHEQERTAVTFRALWRPALALEAWAGRVDTRMTDMSRVGYDDHRLVHDMLLLQIDLQRELQEMGDHVTALEQERAIESGR